MTQDDKPQDRDEAREPEEPTGPIIHDRRRIDPVTGQVRRKDGSSASAAEDAAGAPAGGASTDAASSGAAQAGPAAGSGDQAAPEGAGQGDGEAAKLREQLAERTADLQRVQAEYLNYKRRVERDRQAVRETAVAGVLTELLPVLDDIGRARDHGELEGGFKAVAEVLESTLTKLGLARFGEVGEPFDPHVHEALMHAYSDEVSTVSVSAVLQPGYRLGERVLRPARVAVAEPTETLPADEATGAAEGAAASSQGPAETSSSDPASEGAGSDEPGDTGEGSKAGDAGVDESRPGQG